MSNLLALLLFLAGLIPNILMQIHPNEAVENISAWLRVLSIPVPPWLHKRNADKIIKSTCSLLMLIGFVWLLGPKIYGKYYEWKNPDTKKALWNHSKIRTALSNRLKTIPKKNQTMIEDKSYPKNNQDVAIKYFSEQTMKILLNGSYTLKEDGDINTVEIHVSTNAFTEVNMEVSNTTGLTLKNPLLIFKIANCETQPANGWQNAPCDKNWGCLQLDMATFSPPIIRSWMPTDLPAINIHCDEKEKTNGKITISADEFYPVTISYKLKLNRY